MGLRNVSLGLLVAGMLATGCGGGSGDAAPDDDAGKDDAGRDEAGQDAGGPRPDAGPGSDGGVHPDGAVDGGPGSDGGAHPDAAMDGGHAADAGEGDAGDPSDAGFDADADASTDASTDAEVTLSEVAIYGNCMPIFPPDAIFAFWTATVWGASGSTATLEEAILTVTGSKTITQSLTVDEPTIMLSDGSGSEDQRKIDAEGDEGGCGEICGGATYELDLTFAIDGASVTVVDTGPYTCVF